VKTQIRPHVVPSKLDWISGEVGFRWKEDKLPAMLALHPTGPLGKLIVAGEGPLDNRQYRLELAQRGYVVLCTGSAAFLFKLTVTR